MKYKPSEVSVCLPAGEYEATVEKLTEGKSKSGKEMLTIEFKVYTASGNSFIMKEYIVPESLGKLKMLAKAIGQEAAFNTGEVNPDDYVGRSVLLATKVEEGDGDYGDQARIKAFKPSRATQRTVTPQQSPYNIGQNDPQEDHNIPF